MFDSDPDRAPDSGLDRGAVDAWRTDLIAALRLLTRLPLPAVAGAGPRAARAFPIAGAAIGFAGALALGLGHLVGLPPAAAGALAVAVTALATGALHEDGLADMADGFGGGADRERKLAIMRDSRTGVYGALALILSVSARIAALAALPGPAAAAALIAAHAASRAVLPAVMWRETPARDDGLAVAAGRPPQAAVQWALGLGAGVALLALGPLTGAIALAAAAAAALAVVRLARWQIGGYTGDVLGGVQQAVEIVILLAVAARA